MSAQRLILLPRVLFGLAVLVTSARAQTDTRKVDQAPKRDTASLASQPRADYQARRTALMKQIRELESKRGDEAPAGRGGFGQRAGGDGVREPVVILMGQDESSLNMFEGKYRQKNDFQYLTGVETPSACLILLPNQDRSTLYLPPANRMDRAMEEATDGPGVETAEKFGFDSVDSTGRFLADLFGALEDPRKQVRRRSRVPIVYTFSREGRLASPGGDPQFLKFLREGAPTTEIKDIAPLLAELRKAKTSAEIALLQKAIDITGVAQDSVVKSIRPGLIEYELEAKIQAAFTGNGAQRAGFASIVGSGPNSTIPHYFANRRKLEDGDLVVVDIGAEYDYYTADITRTYPASGKFTPRQRAIYQLVLDAQSAAAARVKVGETTLREMTGWARDFLKQSPLRAKDRDGSEHTMEHFFIHGLGHYLGMDVHDVGDGGKPFQPGEVFTIEPGIYIPSEELGVRIEDDYLTTERGLEKLSKGIPSDPDEIERLIARAKANGKPSNSNAAAGGAQGP